MLLIQQVCEKTMISDNVRCPVCKTGRICDKPLGSQIRAIPQGDITMNSNGSTVILKCPKCGRIFRIQLNNQ